MTQDTKTPPVVEPEHRGSLWKHPYVVYIVLTVAIFVLLLTAAWLALQNDWLPKR